MKHNFHFQNQNIYQIMIQDSRDKTATLMEEVGLSKDHTGTVGDVPP